MKMSALPVYKYDPKDTASWAKKVRNYFVGQCPDAALLLDWAENRQHSRIDQEEVHDCGLAMEALPVQVSEQVWRWLQQPLMGAGTAETDYNNAQTLNGMEV